MRAGLWMIIIGCGDPPEETAEPGERTDETTASVTARLGFAGTSVVAGTAVDYTLDVTVGGEAVAPTAVSLASNLEPGIVSGAESLTPTVAGIHTITATASLPDGSTVEAEALLGVGPGELTGLDLTLERSTVAAGESVAWDLTGLDAFGNPREAPLAAVVEADPEVTVDAGALTSTVAGTWIVAASAGALRDEVSLTVEPAAARVITLELPELVLDAPVAATTTIADAYGNARDDAWTLTASGPSHTILDEAITAQGEGWFEVTATVDGTDVSATVDRLVDVSPPELSWAAPSDASWQDATVLVEGSVTDAWSVPSVRVDGEEVALVKGAFSTTVERESGIATVEVEVADDRGNTAVHSRTMLVGPFLDGSATVRGGIGYRIASVDDLDRLAEELAPGWDPILEPVDPMVLSTSYTQCVDPCDVLPFSCEVCEDIDVEIVAEPPRWGSRDLGAAPSTHGVTLDIAVDLTGIVVPVRMVAESDTAGVITDEEVRWSVDDVRLTVPGTIEPHPDDFVFTAAPSSTELGPSESEAIPLAVLASFDQAGFDFDRVMRERLADALNTRDAPVLAGEMDALLADLDPGTDPRIVVRPGEARPVGSSRVELAYDVELPALAPVVGDLGRGFLATGTPPPVLSGVVSRVFRFDVLNQVGYARWAEGALAQTDPTALALDPGSWTLGGAGGDVSLVTDGRLPPVFVWVSRPSPDRSLPHVQWGALDVTVLVDGSAAFEATTRGDLGAWGMIEADDRVSLVVGELPGVEVELTMLDPTRTDETEARAIAREVSVALIERWLTELAAPLTAPAFTSVPYRVRDSGVAPYVIADIGDYGELP